MPLLHFRKYASQRIRSLIALGHGALVTPNSASMPLAVRTCTTVRGDTLWALALRYYGDGAQWPRIAEANNLHDPRAVPIGLRLVIPAADAPSPAVDSLGAQTLGPVDALLVFWLVQGWVRTSGYGQRGAVPGAVDYPHFHPGHDYGGMEVGSPIYAGTSMVVVKVVDNPQHGYGRHVVVRSAYTDEAVVMMLAHLDAIHVGEGQVLEAGEVLGTLGATGLVNGPHVHIEAWTRVNGILQEYRQQPDPTPYYRIEDAPAGVLAA